MARRRDSTKLCRQPRNNRGRTRKCKRLSDKGWARALPASTVRPALCESKYGAHANADPAAAFPQTEGRCRARPHRYERERLGNERDWQRRMGIGGGLLGEVRARDPQTRGVRDFAYACAARHKDTPGLKPRPEWRTIRSKAERSSSAPSVRLQQPGDVARDAIATVPSTGEEPPPTPVSSADADGTPLPAPPPKPRHADGEHDYVAVAQAREITTFAFDASKPAHVKVGADAGGLRCEP